VAVKVPVDAGVEVCVYITVLVFVAVEVDAGVAVPVGVPVFEGPEGPTVLLFLLHPVTSIKNIATVSNITGTFFISHLRIFYMKYNNGNTK
jgi:hypothetical protein